jgi:hypothetical protein
MNILRCVDCFRAWLIVGVVGSVLPVLASTTPLVNKAQVALLPEGCGNPFQDNSAFFAFFDQAIETAAAKRGPAVKGIADLFAVSELKRELDTLMVNPQEESPIDRLINSQLCLFQKVQTSAKMSGNSKTNPLTIPSDDEMLHDHLLALAPKLYRDCRKIMVEVLSERAKERQKQNILQNRWAEVRKARESGREKIQDLFQ